MDKRPASEAEARHGDRLDDLPDDVMRMPRSRKGVQRKSEIVDAALRIIGREGIQGVSMRAVAAEASVPLGTASYYFSDKDELIEAAFLRHTRRETARIVDAIGAMRGSRTSADLARGLAEFVVQGLTQHREQLITEYQFLTESSRREHLRRASAAWLQSLTAHLEATVAGLSSASPKTDARLILAVLAGLEVDNLGAPPEPATERAIQAVLERLLQGLSELWLHERTNTPRETGR
jgi:DNA-binding transcriptional regulator YbjK